LPFDAAYPGLKGLQQSDAITKPSFGIQALKPMDLHHGLPVRARNDRLIHALLLLRNGRVMALKAFMHHPKIRPHGQQPALIMAFEGLLTHRGPSRCSTRRLRQFRSMGNLGPAQPLQPQLTLQLLVRGDQRHTELLGSRHTFAVNGTEAAGGHELKQGFGAHRLLMANHQALSLLLQGQRLLRAKSPRLR
jgi:hypothetical protein